MPRIGNYLWNPHNPNQGLLNLPGGGTIPAEEFFAQQAIANNTDPEAPPPPGGTGGGGGGGGGVIGGNPRSLYASMGGQKGTQMDFKEFKEWYRNQTEQVGMDLSEFISTSGLQTSTAGGKDAKYGPGATYSAGSDISNYLQPSYLSDAGELHVLNQRSGGNYSSLEDAMNQLALGAGFAGVEQWNQNMGEGRGNLPSHLLNTSMQDIRYEPRAYELMFNSLMEDKDPKARLEAQSGLVPEWASSVDEALQGQVDINREDQTGIPFGFELMSGANINYNDDNQTLWEGAYPPALQGLHHNQQGEGAFAQSLSMEELMRDIWPLMQAQYHGPAGAPPPFEAGLSFGGGGVDPKTGRNVDSPLFGFRGEISQPDPDALRLWGAQPGTSTDWASASGPEGWAGGLYNRWAAHQMPGTSDYNPRFSGTLSGANPDLTTDDWSFNTDNMDPQMLASLEEMIQKQEDQYWNYPLYAPWRNLPPEVRQRFMALIGSPLGPGGETTLTEGLS